MLNRNKMLTLFIGNYSKFSPIEIEELSKKFEIIFATNEKYKVPYNIALISNDKKCIEKVEMKFIFFNLSDYNYFIEKNKDLVIEDLKKRKRVYFKISIMIK